MTEQVTSEHENDSNFTDMSSSIISNSGSEIVKKAGNIEYEGPHMIHLRQALQKTRKKCIGSLRYSTFARKYTFAHEAAPHVLRSVLGEFKEQLDTMIKGELEEMIEQENLVPLFNNLDQLIKSGESNTSSTPAWRPSGIPQQDVQDHLYKVKLEEKEKLQKILEATEQERERLKGLVDKKRQQMGKTQQKIQDHLDMFDKAAVACSNVPMAEMATFQMKIDM